MIKIFNGTMSISRIKIIHDTVVEVVAVSFIPEWCGVTHGYVWPIWLNSFVTERGGCGSDDIIFTHISS